MSTLNLAEYIKQNISPLFFYESLLPNLSTKGKVWRDAGLCLFHDDKKAGSKKVNIETGAFTCFACGAKGGDIIAFAQLLYGLDFYPTLQKLAADFNLLLPTKNKKHVITRCSSFL